MAKDTLYQSMKKDYNLAIWWNPKKQKYASSSSVFTGKSFLLVYHELMETLKDYNVVCFPYYALSLAPEKDKSKALFCFFFIKRAEWDDKSKNLFQLLYLGCPFNEAWQKIYGK
jgi:hypothetical protein